MFDWLHFSKNKTITPSNFMMEITMDELVNLVSLVDKTIALSVSLNQEVTQLKADVANHVIDATAVKAQKDADDATAAALKADTDAKLKAMADKLAALFPAV